jgi:hypothetical protein
LSPVADVRERLAPLWARSTDWGELTPERLNHFAVNAPGGSASVVTAAAESGDLVGATFFVPLRVMVRGREVRAHRPTAFLLDPSVRLGMVSADPTRHPIMAMYFFAVDQFRARGDSMLVTIPNPRWARILKAIPGMRTAIFPLMSLSVPLTEPFPENGDFSFRPLENFDSRIDLLGAAVAAQYNCTILRDARSIEWKAKRGVVDVTAVEKNGALVGVVVSRKKGDRQWLICEILAAGAEDVLMMSVIAATQAGHLRAITETSSKSIEKVAILATPRMMPVLDRLGFVRDAWDFPLAVHPLDSSLSGEDIAPGGWYVTGDD